jgi:hypothetical protein
MSTRATDIPPPRGVARLSMPAPPQPRDRDRRHENGTEHHAGDPVRKKIANWKRVRRRRAASSVPDDPADEHPDHPSTKKPRDRGDAADTNIGPDGISCVIRHASPRVTSRVSARVMSHSSARAVRGASVFNTRRVCGRRRRCRPSAAARSLRVVARTGAARRAP